MPEYKDPLLEALKEGKSYTWTTPDGGNFASMRKAIKHGQTLTMSPVANPAEVQVGDIVLVKWHKGYLFHMVGEVEGDRFLIVNSMSGINGWVDGSDILGRVTRIIDPEPRPDVPAMLEQLREAYCAVIQSGQPSGEDANRLLEIADDLEWYADRIGMARWDTMPRSNKWSFEQNLWRLTKQAKIGAAPVPGRVCFMIDCGVRCLGLAAEIIALFEYGDDDS